MPALGLTPARTTFLISAGPVGACWWGLSDTTRTPGLGLRTRLIQFLPNQTYARHFSAGGATRHERAGAQGRRDARSADEGVGITVDMQYQTFTARVGRSYRPCGLLGVDTYAPVYHWLWRRRQVP